MNKMKKAYFMITALGLLLNGPSLGAWELLDMMKSSYNSGIKTVREGSAGERFNPHRDIRYLPPLDYHDIFRSIDNLSVSRDPQVREYLFLYLTRGREYVKKAIEKEYIYGPILDEVYRRHSGIPREIMLLPLLESGFNPYAVSRSRATGIWQFLLNTSRPLGLLDNRWVDERRDLEKSTDAALRQLKSLYERFGSWELALTAYNGGRGLVERGIKKAGTGDIWVLRKSGALTEEASQFLARYIALVLIFKNQGLYGIRSEISLPERTATEKILIDFPVSLHHVARFSAVPMNTIRRYNPELNSDSLPPFSGGYSLRLPVDGKERLERTMKELRKLRLNQAKTHVVKTGETLTQIGTRYRITPGDIMRLNGLKNPHLLKPGQIINIPN